MGYQQNRQSFETGLAASFASLDIPFEGICVKDLKDLKDPKDPKGPKDPKDPKDLKDPKDPKGP